MATHILTPSRWSAKHIILAAALILTAVVIAATISIGLSPARIRFSITDAAVNGLGSKEHEASYNFTIMVENRSWHTKVHFAALSIEISYGRTGWVPAEVDTTALTWHWVQPRHTNNISASAGYSQYTEAAPPTPPSPPSATPTNTATPPLPPPPPPPAPTTNMTKVELIAIVLFKFGLATTRPYNVRTSCSPVYFFGNRSAIVDCNP